MAVVLAALLTGVALTARALRREWEFSRLQSDFVATVSHEFRSPLTGIRQLAELLDSGIVQAGDRRRDAQPPPQRRDPRRSAPGARDREALASAVLNLVDNAFKYSPPDSPVRLAAHSGNGRLSISITDRGPGIAPKSRRASSTASTAAAATSRGR